MYLYLAFKHSHLLTAILSVLLTVVWTALAWKGGKTPAVRLQGKTKTIYVVHRIAGGLAGLTGLVVTFVGPWRTFVFPYIGLGAFLIHGFAASISKTTFFDEKKAIQRKAALLIQIGVLIVSTYVMTYKPF